MLYHGVDLVEVARVRRAVMRYGQRFLCRVYTATEQADCIAAPGGNPFMKRWQRVGRPKRPVPKRWGLVCAVWGRWPLPINHVQGFRKSK
jgi:hypothetical protein